MFGRNRQQGPPRPLVTNGPGVMSIPAGPGGYQAGWKGMPGQQNPSQQIGLYDGQLLNQFPASVTGVMLHSGREWGRSGWYTPTVANLPNGTIQQTTRPNNVTGSQRYGSIYGGPVGPLSVRKNMAAVTAQQVRLSGMSALDWARGLSN